MEIVIVVDKGKTFEQIKMAIVRAGIKHDLKHSFSEIMNGSQRQIILVEVPEASFDKLKEILAPYDVEIGQVYEYGTKTRIRI